jgi:hypothetical protein
LQGKTLGMIGERQGNRGDIATNAALWQKCHDCARAEDGFLAKVAATAPFRDWLSRSADIRIIRKACGVEAKYAMRQVLSEQLLAGADRGASESRTRMSRIVEKSEIVGSAWRGLFLAAGLVACGGVAARAAPERAEAVSGQWELSRDETGLKCRLALRVETAANAQRILALPYGCRKAFPILADVQGWVFPESGQVLFVNSAGNALLVFNAASDEYLTATGPDNATYRLTSTRALARAEPPAGVGPLVGPLVEPRSSRPTSERQEVASRGPTSPAGLRLGDISGRYAILREGGRDTGCMVTLDDRSPAKGGSKAFLAPACRDQGIVIFDPVAWRMVNGRLVLTARKGHSAFLDLQPDGTWLKDPTDGKRLALKKL